MTLRPRSIRVRLAIWYAAALAAIVVAFALGIYLFVRSSLLREVDAQLERDLATVSRVLREEPFEINELAQHGSVEFFQVSQGNEVVAETPGWSREVLEKALAGLPHGPGRSWRSHSGQAFRIRSVVLPGAGQSRVVAVAESEQTLRTSLESIGMILLFGIPIAVVLAVAGGYFLAGRVLNPIEEITALAGAITAERLSERLPVDNPGDEFGRLAQMLNGTFARLEDSFERLRRFSADASHELRTPLTALRSVGEVGLQRELDAAGCREVIASMLEETDRLTKLVDCLLTLSRGDAGGLTVTRVRVDLAEMAADAVDMIGVLAEEKGQVIELEAGAGVCAMVNPEMLRQALINLLDNAVKYSPPGRIDLRVYRTERGEAALEVQDQGPGIAREHQELIFDRFYRADPGRSREQGGAGLGLAITRQAVELNGGRIQLESEAGQGCRFTILFPLV
ncbi:heavy metal sensor histidine kinase [Geomonas sp. Red69]|uniref:sensor histidine kinase n=1 Tax=Geomonas diazotrophica TaxID=2843197 RepID=UPI001C1078AC|nr:MULTISPECIES: heavy metal sensor histidine kinase [Geomonas]MBU5635337.1 heavy metal sensor histidine kinase [Geomonas diazotrophica]QXE86748.1 heavy metal sensor histidine kinase [Geomonas nitrogeniifigens]